MTRCGMPARFPRTGSACWKETSPKRSFRGFWEKHGPGSCSVTNTSRWMEHCWKPGRRTKASGQSILWARITTRSRNHRRHGGTRITPRSTIAERNALIRHTVPPPIVDRGVILVPPCRRWDENNPTVNYRGEKRTNQTHCSTTDPQAMLARKGPGKEAKLSYHGHLMTENRSGLVVNTQVTTAYGSAECHAGLLMAEQLPGCGRVTLGADKGYDQREFVEELRCMGVTPHVAQNQGRRRSRLDQRTTRHPGYEISQRKRKRIEEVFGWMKTVGMLRQLRHRGLERV